MPQLSYRRIPAVAKKEQPHTLPMTAIAVLNWIDDHMCSKICVLSKSTFNEQRRKAKSMELLKTSDTVIELAGTAKEFSALARALKKSKVSSKNSIILDGICENIELSCTKSITRISMDSSIRIEFTEETKNQLHALIAIPSDANSGSLFVLNPIDHEGIFTDGSMGIVLNIKEKI